MAGLWMEMMPKKTSKHFANAQLLGLQLSFWSGTRTPHDAHPFSSQGHEDLLGLGTMAHTWQTLSHVFILQVQRKHFARLVRKHTRNKSEDAKKRWDHAVALHIFPLQPTLWGANRWLYNWILFTHQKCDASRPPQTSSYHTRTCSTPQDLECLITRKKTHQPQNRLNRLNGLTTKKDYFCLLNLLNQTWPNLWHVLKHLGTPWHPQIWCAAPHAFFGAKFPNEARGTPVGHIDDRVVKPGDRDREEKLTAKCREWVNTYRYIFNGMNIHLPAILMFTRGTRFWPIPM